MKQTIRQLTGPLVRPFTEFFQTESSSGIVLLAVSVLALGLANTDAGVAAYFPAIWETPLGITVGAFSLSKPLTHWINDGLMALFFLIVGLEIKREVLEGELSSLRQATLPIAGAVGGMLLPAALYGLVNHGTPTASGWGIPMATDIAFALAVLQLLGERAPLSLKIFLTALAIVDDLGAVTVVALFYTQSLAMPYLLGAGGVWGLLLLLNRLGLTRLRVYMMLGAVLWYLVLKSGVHATVAGVLLAVAIPFRIRYSTTDLMQLVQNRFNLLQMSIARRETDPRGISEELQALHGRISSPAQRLEENLHGFVSFAVVPLFAFCNTSVRVDTTVLASLGSPLSVGILLGLLVGKPLGILLFTWLAVRFGGVSLPMGVSWRHIGGVACLAGIGFTMSIFITLLAFDGQPQTQAVAKVAILLASLAAGLLGYRLLRRAGSSERT